MSQNHFNYLSQVPVKIAENYKPPKKVTLNQNIAQRLTNVSNVTAHCTYDFSLEHAILAQMNEWQNIRQRSDDERKKRLCSYQQQRQKQYEENQKQIITAVSYPSTDDLSSDDDGDSGHGTSSDSKPSSATKIPIENASAQQQQQQFQFSPTNRFDSILVPTVMGERHGNQSDNGNVTKSKTPLHSKFNFQEFENYSSNPFDNVEMKTINDLDILTEVWNSSVAISKSTDSTESQPSEPETPTQPEATQQPNDSQNNFAQNECYNTNQLYHTQTQHSELTQTQLNHSTAAITNIVPTQLNDYYSNQMNFNYQAGNGSGAMGSTAFLPNQPIHAIPINNNTSYGNMQNQYVNTYYNSMISGVPGRTMETTDSVSNKESVIATQSKSKSRSVPDIVKVVNGGDSQRMQGRRTRNSSQCDDTESTSRPPNTTRHPTYHKLSTSSQNLAKSISSMGFPLERVARVANRLGRDDKKIIEHLIPLSELLDLGFDENKISDALIKFDNNKERALDFLIS